jgi:hypothetical protein
VATAVLDWWDDDGENDGNVNNNEKQNDSQHNSNVEDVVYLQPYWIPRWRSGKWNCLWRTKLTVKQKIKKNSLVKSSIPPFPLFEMLGPFVGYNPTTPRLPVLYYKMATVAKPLLLQLYLTYVKI